MAKHILKIRQVDRIVFDTIKNGQKTIETRAATDKYRKVEMGDVLVFICENDRLEKSVKKVNCYKNISELAKAVNFKSIMPFIDSARDMKKALLQFPGNKEKIEKFGIMSFELE